MSQKDILSQFNSLPPEAQRQVLDFMAILQAHYGNAQSNERKESSDISEEVFVGLWQDREDMQESTAWVRSSREREWIKQSG
jgi:L-arabinose isomerase